MTFWDGKNLIGFDTSPGNCLVDNFMKEKFKLNFDNNGEIARKGNVINLLLKKNFKKIHIF